MKSKSREDRFFAKIEKSANCWIWKGAINSTGYGTFFLSLKNIPAHRASWIIHNGDIPKNMEVCHHCDNPICVNPGHLFIGTHGDNMRDMQKKGRRKPSRMVGAINPMSVLSKEDVENIRDIYSLGGLTQKQIGAYFGVKQTTISAIVNRVNWGHL